MHQVPRVNRSGDESATKQNDPISFFASRNTGSLISSLSNPLQHSKEARKSWLIHPPFPSTTRFVPAMLSLFRWKTTRRTGHQDLSSKISLLRHRLVRWTAMKNGHHLPGLHSATAPPCIHNNPNRVVRSSISLLSTMIVWMYVWW